MNSKEQFDKWVSDWDSAVKGGFLDKAAINGADEETEAEVGVSADSELIQEEVKVNPKDMAKAMVNSPNPIKPHTMGMDQDMTDPVSMGATYDVADLEQLNDLKVKLHGLLDKLNTMHGFGEATSKLESKIAEVQKQIDEISNGLSKGVPSQQGD